jgi:hypothetical protein
MNQNVKLMLHCGAQRATRDELELVETPPSTKTWCPIPHTTLIDSVKNALCGEVIDVTAEEHALTKGGDNYFGILQVSNRSVSEDYAYVVGLRNSHTQKYVAELVVGSHVFVCDNLAFSGEIRVARKHTTNILRDLNGLTMRAVGFLAERWLDQNKRIEAYKEYHLTDMRVHDLIIRSLDAGVITSTQVPKVLHEYREPQHQEFEPRTAWSYFNGVTEVLKGIGVFSLPNRTRALHGLLDHQVGLLDNLAREAHNN